VRVNDLLTCNHQTVEIVVSVTRIFWGDSMASPYLVRSARSLKQAWEDREKRRRQYGLSPADGASAAAQDETATTSEAGDSHAQA